MGHFLDSIFSVPFKEMGFGFYRFFIFLTFFGSFYFFGSFFYRFWILSFFYRFLVFSVLVECGISRATFFWILKNVKKVKKVEKSRKNDVFWGPKKRVKVGPFCTTPIFGQKSCFLAS